MASVTDWLNESARFMMRECPELYSDLSDALGDLILALDHLRDDGGDGTILFGPYMMYRSEDDGVEEVFLTRKVSSVVLFEDEGICRAYGWTDGINLDDPLDDDLDEC